MCFGYVFWLCVFLDFSLSGKNIIKGLLGFATDLLITFYTIQFQFAPSNVRFGDVKDFA